MKNPSLAFSLALIVTVLVASILQAESILTKTVSRVPVAFSGGHDTDPRDKGRPVVLIAAALEVPTDVFREAFSHVHPAPPGSGGPTAEAARQNKDALLSALGKYGVINERLDQVSNYYRYVRSRDKLWTCKPAVANALVQNGAVIGYEIIDGGAGYSSAPTVTVPQMNNAKVEVKLAYGKNLANNGSISAITVPQSK